MLKDVILLAKGETRFLCPFDAEEVWGVNDVGSDPKFKEQRDTEGNITAPAKKIHRIFRFDPTPPALLDEMKAIAPITSWQDYADVKYPIDEITKEFNTEYLSNTISYMIAYAIHTGVKKLRLYGVDAPYGGIYDIERSGIEYWIGRAEGRGMKIIPSAGSHLLRTITGTLYGKGREGNIPLYFAERLILMNVIPLQGHYEDMDKSFLVRWLVTPKERECKQYGIQVQKQPNGVVNYHCPNEFASDVWMPKESWEYIYKCLKQREAEGKLPVEAVTIYKKLVKLTEGGEG